MQPRKRPFVVAAARFGVPMTELRDLAVIRTDRPNLRIRPIAAVEPAIGMLRCGPSDRTFAAAANTGVA